MHIYLIALLGIALCIGVSTPVDAQVLLQGRVVDEETGAPIVGAHVLLLDGQHRQVGAQLVDEEGYFNFRVRRDGPYRLRASRMGYRENISPRLWLGEHEFVAVELRLHPDAVLLAPLEVVARSAARASPVLDNFRTRLLSGIGTFITREDIERLRPAMVTDLLATVPGVRLEAAGRGTQRVVYMTRAISGGRDCPAQVFIDGFLLNRRMVSGAENRFVIDDAVSPTSVEGIEIYQGLSGVPAEFMNQDARCGVVAIWTRRGGV